MAISTAMCTSFKKEILEAVHNFKNSGGSTFNLALYTSSASLGASTTAYTTSNEVSGTGYTAKGAALTRVDPSTSGTTALTDFSLFNNILYFSSIIYKYFLTDFHKTISIIS